MSIPRIGSVVGYWKGNLNQDGTLQDFNPNAGATLNHGTLVSAPPQVETPYGSALDYDGSADFVTIPRASVFDITTTDTKTFSFLFKMNDSGINTFISQSDGGIVNDTGYRIQITNSQLRFVYNDGGAIVTTESSSATFQIGVWQLATVTVDYLNTRIVVYVNDEFDSVHTMATSTTLVKDIAQAIGSATSNDASNPFNGIIAHTIIWNVALNPNEVLAHYNAIQELTERS